MKKSKMFLRATTFILTIAAIIATKTKKLVIITGYYSVIGGNGCTKAVAGACNPDAGLCTIMTSYGSHIPLFTYRFGSPCVNQLARK